MDIKITTIILSCICITSHAYDKPCANAFIDVIENTMEDYPDIVYKITPSLIIPHIKTNNSYFGETGIQKEFDLDIWENVSWICNKDINGHILNVVIDNNMYIIKHQHNTNYLTNNHTFGFNPSINQIRSNRISHESIGEVNHIRK
jgi:hypothetical protein